MFMETLNLIKSYETDTGSKRRCDTASHIKGIAMFNQDIGEFYSTPKAVRPPP